MATTLLLTACLLVRIDSKQATSFTNKSWKLHSLTVAPAIDWDTIGEKYTDIFG